MKRLGEIPEEKRIYVDETGKDTEMDREYGYAAAGERVEGITRGRKAERLNIVAAKCGETILEAHEYGCSMNNRLFE
jgi:hypothetical protein